MAALEARDLYRFYHAANEETLALRGVSMTVDPGELVAVMGPSGSGKSTLLACLAGLDEPDGGTVLIDGQVMTRRTEPERAAMRAAGIGMLFQTANLIEHLTVAQNVTLAQQMSGRPDAARRKEVLAELGLTERAHANPSQLSGGEAVRAGLAVALANDPSVVLADEPTGEVDKAIEHRILTLLHARADAGAAVVVVTHSDAVAASADRTIALEDGRIAS
ncbi:MAG: ATP-binding cassette domain-containing protein [Acidimicrobiales bacterium]|nr:ATP-binding cassette domain-containing protein [Acidimicrobiales bacterium]